tara:strand:- start:1204 stop:1443 length:240 start_codon:yes stop_codon:yes gene_type:complete
MVWIGGLTMIIMTLNWSVAIVSKMVAIVGVREAQAILHTKLKIANLLIAHYIIVSANLKKNPMKSFVIPASQRRRSLNV